MSERTKCSASRCEDSSVGVLAGSQSPIVADAKATHSLGTMRLLGQNASFTEWASKPCPLSIETVSQDIPAPAEKNREEQSVAPCLLLKPTAQSDAQGIQNRILETFDRRFILALAVLGQLARGPSQSSSADIRAPLIGWRRLKADHSYPDGLSFVETAARTSLREESRLCCQLFAPIPFGC